MTKKTSKKVDVPSISNDYFLVVKVGSDERPAGPADIEAVQDGLAQMVKNGKTYFVTHHAVNFEVLPLKLIQ